MAGSALLGSRERDDAYVRAHLEPLLGASLPPAQRQDLDVYLTELRSWGARLDLVAPRDADEFLDLALCDAAIVARTEATRGASHDSVIDVGSGGGAPGIPLAILLGALRGSAQLTLVEPRAKRVTFLRSVTSRLTTVRIDVVKGRSDGLPAGSASVAVARATLPPGEWLGEGARLATRAVWVLLARGTPPERPGWQVDADVEYAWPLVRHARRALRYVPATPG